MIRIKNITSDRPLWYHAGQRKNEPNSCKYPTPGEIEMPRLPEFEKKENNKNTYLKNIMVI